MNLSPLKGISAHRILEHAAFFELPVTVFDDEKPTQRVVGYVKDVGENNFSFQFKRWSIRTPITELNRGRLTFLMRYRGRALTFHSGEPDGTHSYSLRESSTHIFTVPSNLFFTDTRQADRLDLSGFTELEAFCELTSNGEALPIKLRFLSRGGISFSSADGRAFDQIKENSEISSLKIFKSGKPLLITQGIIIRIDTWVTEEGMEYRYVMGTGIRDTTEQISSERRVSDFRISLRAQTAFVQFRHPIFSNHLITSDIRDISTSGISFLLDQPRFPLIPGMLINELSIQLPGKTRHITAVRIISVSISEDQWTRVGGEFSNLTIPLLKDISTFVSKRSVSNITEATEEEFDDLWEFFFETGFLYKSKQMQLKKHGTKILETSKKLLSSNNPVAKVVLYKKASEIRGHISTVRFFDSSWIIQHLASKGIEDAIIAGKAMVDSMSAFFRNAKANSLTGSKFILFYFRPDNIYPAALFNGVLQSIGDSNICQSVDLQFSLPTSKFALWADGGWKAQEELRSPGSQVRVATQDDLLQLEQLLKKEDPSLLLSEDLGAETVRNFKISSDYSRLGLERSRQVFVAERNGQRAYAVCNYSSPGINFSELTNSFRLFYSDGSRFDSSAELQLIRTVFSSYQSSGIMPVLLSDMADEIPAGFELKKVYTRWLLNISYVDRFKAATDYVFSNLKRFIKRQKMKCAPQSSQNNRQAVPK